MNMTKFWNITCAGREAEIDIFGVIGDVVFFEDQSTLATDFIRELRGIGKSVTKLNVNLHSEGGSVADGFAIYNALRDHPADKVMHVASMAYSIASVIMLAGDKIEVAPDASVMIHNPMGLAMGGEKDFRHAADVLAGAKSRILNVYGRRTGADRDHLSELMDQETWFQGGDEIKAAGFADTVKKDQPKMRIAAGPLKLTGYWRHPPKAIIDRKPQPLTPEQQAKADRMEAFCG